MKDRQVKQVILGGGYKWEGSGHKGRASEWMYFLFTHENKRMKSVEIVL
jgi:hypothetical protein